MVLFSQLILFSWIYSALGQDANLVLLNDAVEEGAVCLDGTAPGYYFKPGTGEGSSKWKLFLKGGGWCYDEEDCLERSRGKLGSSKSWPSSMKFEGFLSDDKTVNPDFYQWNAVYMMYCDGASFAGDVEKPLDMNGTKIYFRGFRVLKANLRSLLERGLKDASEVVLAGGSAGGLATYLHVDYIKSILHSSVKYGALADAGYFIDAVNITGQYHIRGLYQYVYKMQNCSGGVNQDCIKTQQPAEEWRCFMAQYTYPYIKNPIFSLNSQVDTWQLGNILQLGCTPPNCTDEQMMKFREFYEAFKKAEQPILSASNNGGFLDSCLMHVSAESNSHWMNMMVDGQSLRDTFANWYFKRSEGKGKVVDCAYPCNKSCGL